MFSLVDNINHNRSKSFYAEMKSENAKGIPISFDNAAKDCGIKKVYDFSM